MIFSLKEYGGMSMIPEDWPQQLELKELVMDMGEKLYRVNEYFGML